MSYSLPVTNPNIRVSGLIVSRLIRFGLILVLDTFFSVAALYLGMLVRFEGAIPPEWAIGSLLGVPVLLSLRTLFTVISGTHRWSFRLAGLNEALRLLASTAAGSAVFVLIAFAFDWLPIPRSVLVLEFFMTTSLMAAFRFAPRVAAGWYVDRARAKQEDVLRTLIVGAGSAGDLLIRDLQHSATSHRYHVIGFVDDDAEKLGTMLNGKPVLGDVDLLPRFIAKFHVNMVLIAVANLEADRLRYILRLCAHHKVHFKIIPPSFMDERVSAAMLHDLSPEDLLPREPVAFDAGEVRSLLQGRRVLVTGAAGSIGSEISRQVASYGPSSLVLVDVNENELYFLTRRLQEVHKDLKITSLIANIRDAERLSRIGEEHKPNYVFHAAAHKHVPLMEDAPDEAVKNNVFGTMNVARMADAVGADRFVLISTDKAVSPSSVMGCTKRVAELVVRDLARRSKTSFTAVRFGNVLGSAGSVVPLFKEQIERGGPVTVTHPDCTRYFMTIKEACGLVLLAGLGGHGELCILDMGEPIRIAELAEHMITMAGLVPGQDIPIVFTGLRPGEKLQETLLTEEEEQTQVVRNKIRAAQSPEPPNDLVLKLQRLHDAADSGSALDVKAVLREIVPSYQHPTDVVVSPPSGGRERLAQVMPLRPDRVARN